LNGWLLPAVARVSRAVVPLRLRDYIYSDVVAASRPTSLDLIADFLSLKLRT
jgi:hypothetical protein